MSHDAAALTAGEETDHLIELLNPQSRSLSDPYSHSCTMQTYVKSFAKASEQCTPGYSKATTATLCTHSISIGSSSGIVKITSAPFTKEHKYRRSIQRTCAIKKFVVLTDYYSVLPTHPIDATMVHSDDKVALRIVICHQIYESHISSVVAGDVGTRLQARAR